ncbi:ABC transporter ATP-binding protein [Gordonia spumicola]|uniref:ABC transporter ATP-binding protein n=1 Tax=Gordonia spumicola TaxID=589161 RepID=A0A7I9V3E1_9ACTN|nr:ATP-binding cassette domain-containing protein [Gordonia spumicola]GED99938.1 ABC transporter ATP-binding protein [Gordonia spumicola]GEE04064.1 ABC transporter ATP-binding protein [Gordonia spumicola]GEE04079.1 ABC transporter ATP-binding protein [Gordonia spumicola]
MSRELVATLEVKRAAFTVAVDIAVPSGGCVALLGPNGSGKSTVLGALAGLVPLTAGAVRVGDRVLDGDAHMPPDRRRVTLLEQKPRLFPHLSVADNIAFGPIAQGTPRREALALAREWLRRIGLSDVGRRRPERLSGGQQQRVAIARALAAEPDVLLLDEPFAALDATSAPIIRRLLADELSRTGTTCVLVTHDLSDAWQWASRCIVLDAGRVVEDAAPAHIVASPATPFSAALAGYSVIHGRWADGTVITDDHVIPGDAGGDVRDGDPVFGAVAPRDVGFGESGVVADRVRAVSVRAGRAYVEGESGLVAEAPVTVDLPTAGQSVWLTPHRMIVRRASVQPRSSESRTA